jgi:hypothetical protein
MDMPNTTLDVNPHPNLNVWALRSGKDMRRLTPQATKASKQESKGPGSGRIEKGVVFKGASAFGGVEECVRQLLLEGDGLNVFRYEIASYLTT